MWQTGKPCGEHYLGGGITSKTGVRTGLTRASLITRGFTAGGIAFRSLLPGVHELSSLSSSPPGQGTTGLMIGGLISGFLISGSVTTGVIEPASSP